MRNRHPVLAQSGRGEDEVASAMRPAFLRHLNAMLSPPARPARLLTMLETLERANGDGVTLARFGDGELKIAITGRGIGFQPASSGLVGKLNAALLEPKPGYVACYNSQFMQSEDWHWIRKFERYGSKSGDVINVCGQRDVLVLRRKRQAAEYRRMWNIVASETKIENYGAAGVFYIGLYVEQYREGRIDEILERFRRLFLRRRILFVCPERPMGGLSFGEQVPLMQRLGMVDAQFISIPDHDAFAVTDDVLAQIRSRKGFDDVFLQAGPAASVWAHNLAGNFDGRVLDVGSLNTQLRYLM